MFFCKSDPVSCDSLLAILEKYEAASGQRINLQKSAITFSAKTPAAIRIKVKERLLIEAEGGIGKYLGLTEHFSCRKRDIFANIVDRIRQRSHSWSSKFLNRAGKQVLLKAVLTAMPAYAMSCFKLPLSLCKQIQSVLTRFWWDVKPKLRKMSWVSWTTLTRAKADGGLGFRDIERFNDALLGKLAWRILSNPDSLLSQILLGKYCQDTPFLEASIPGAASHGWRGVMAGREVMKRGLCWLIGSGKDIGVWQNSWLSLSESMAPMGPPFS